MLRTCAGTSTVWQNDSLYDLLMNPEIDFSSSIKDCPQIAIFQSLFSTIVSEMKYMNSGHFSGLLLVLFGMQAIAAQPTGLAESNSAVASKVDEKPGPDGFIDVFNGKDLAGWSGDPQFWSVEEGTLTGVTDGSLKMNRFITWNGRPLKNFEMRVKVKITNGGNSGLQYRGTSRPDLGPDVVTGYQCDIVSNNPDYNGMLYEERGRRILSHTGEKVIIAPDGQPWIVGKMPVKVFAPNEWHDYRVLVVGNHHQHWIDGHQTADLIDLDEKGRALEGVLAVQVHVGPAMKVQFKDFKIKRFPEDAPILTLKSHPIPAGSLGVKPQGKLPANWQPPVYRAPE